MAECKILYYIVDDVGCVYCTDGGFHVDQSWGKFKAYKRLSAALEKARMWRELMGKKGVRVVDQEGNEVSK